MNSKDFWEYLKKVEDKKIDFKDILVEIYGLNPKGIRVDRLEPTETGFEFVLEEYYCQNYDWYTFQLPPNVFDMTLLEFGQWARYVKNLEDEEKERKRLQAEIEKRQEDDARLEREQEREYQNYLRLKEKFEKVKNG